MCVFGKSFGAVWFHFFVQGQQIFWVNDQMVIILGLQGHVVAGCCVAKAAAVAVWKCTGVTVRQETAGAPTARLLQPAQLWLTPPSSPLCRRSPEHQSATPLSPPQPWLAASVSVLTAPGTSQKQSRSVVLWCQPYPLAPPPRASPCGLGQGLGRNPFLISSHRVDNPLSPSLILLRVIFSSPWFPRNCPEKASGTGLISFPS